MVNQVIPLGVGLGAVVTLVNLPLVQFWDHMYLHVLLKVALLGEAGVTFIAPVWLNTKMHLNVVNQIPAFGAFLPTAFELALVDDSVPLGVLGLEHDLFDELVQFGRVHSGVRVGRLITYYYRNSVLI